MIAKSIKAQSFGGCVNYVMKNDAELLKAEGVMATSAKSMITSFELQRSTRPEIKSPAGHIPISFAPEDRERMTNEFMVKLADEYMERMGIKDTQYIIVRHHDGDNEHLHIIYNRINNEKKLISLNNDFKRNEQVCKAMKDKYGLTYGVNKFKVKREKLRGSERVKHDIYHAVREEVVHCRTIEELQGRLKSRGVEMAYKYRRGTNEPQGVLFTKDNITFKGSQIDRNFSYRGIQEMSKAMDIEWEKIDEQHRLAQQKRESQRPKHNFRHDIPSKIGSVPLTEQQRITLDSGESVCFKDRTNSQGEKFDVYAIWSTQENKLNFYYEDPCNLDLCKEQQQQQQSQQSHDSFYDEPSSSTGLFDFIDDCGDNPDEQLFRKRMQQQQKKKKRGIKM
ncbi:MAG: relaxase/mobilization nuclease domain-containing protein [Rikenellaceae bacterium]